MQNKYLGSKCSLAASPSVTRMERLSRLLLSRRVRTRRSQAGFSPIDGGLVRSYVLVGLVSVKAQCYEWYLGNTRVISQTALDHFRTSLSERKDDPYSVLLRRNKLPMALLDDAANPHLRKVRQTILSSQVLATDLFAEASAYCRGRAVRRNLWPKITAEETENRCWYFRGARKARCYCGRTG